MPHILLKKHKQIDYYNNQDVVKTRINFIAKSLRDIKIGLSSGDKEFLFTKVDRDGDDLIKLDNATRVTPVSFMQNALNDYAKITGSEVLFSNTTSIYNKMEVEESYLKSIEYFLNEFKTDKEIWIEIGFGSGRHLLYQAKENPDKILIGLEIHTPSIEQVLKQIKLENIKNVLTVNYDARLFLEFLNSNSVGKIFVHFPVPWDKKPHRRVFSEEFIEESLRVLKIDGSLELRTDSPNYYEYSKGLVESFNEYPSSIKKNQDLSVVSKYEARWKRQEKDIWDITIVSTKKSPAKKIEGNFDFSDIDNSEDNIKKIIKNIKVFQNKFLVHFEDIYDIFTNNIKNGLLIKVTFGSFNRPVTKYIIIQNNKARYLQGEPIKTETNLLSHNYINNILNDNIK